MIRALVVNLYPSLRLGLILSGLAAALFALLVLAGKPPLPTAAWCFGLALHLIAADVFVSLLRAAVAVTAITRVSPSPARQLIPYLVAAFALSVFGAWLTRVPL